MRQFAGAQDSGGKTHTRCPQGPGGSPGNGVELRLFVVKGLWRRGGILDESDYLSELPVEHTDPKKHGVGSLMNFRLLHVTSVQFMLLFWHPKPPWAATVLILTRRLEWKAWSHTVLLVSRLLSLRR